MEKQEEEVKEMEINRGDDGDQKKNSGKRKETHDDSGGVRAGQKKQKSMKSTCPTPEIPEKFKNYISQLGFSEPVLVMQRAMDKSLFEELQRFFLIPLEDVNQILTDQQKQYLEKNRFNVIVATLIGPSLSYSRTSINKWDNFHYALNISRKEFEQYHELSHDTLFQLWCFKNGSEPGFALVEVNKTNMQVQKMTAAPEIPEEIKNRIASFKGSDLVFIIRKTLLKSDVRGSKNNPSRFSIPLEQLENQFLSDEEKEDFVKLCNEGYDAVLIGPSIDNENVKEFKVKVRKWISYYLEGAGWKNFVKKYGLKEDKKVLAWSFRRPSVYTDSQLGTVPSKIGFAIAVVDEEEEEQSK